jgi:hypothetical protein
MPEYQLHVAGALVAAAVCSAAVLALSGVKDEGQIKLPEESFDGTRDPFNVTKVRPVSFSRSGPRLNKSQPEDVIDGEPLNERAFWANVCISCASVPSVLAHQVPDTSGSSPQDGHCLLPVCHPRTRDR